MLDHWLQSLRAFGAGRGWTGLRPRERIGAIYTLVRNEDGFYAGRGVNLNGVRRWLFKGVVRQRMNRGTQAIRRAARERADVLVRRAPGDSAASRRHLRNCLAPHALGRSCRDAHRRGWDTTSSITLASRR